MLSSIQNLLILVGILLIAGLGYYLFTQNQGASLHNSEVDNQAAIKTAETLRRLNEISTLSLDGTIFSDPRFTSLIPFSNEIIPEPHGKTNPFVQSY